MQFPGKYHFCFRSGPFVGTSLHGMVDFSGLVAKDALSGKAPQVGKYALIFQHEFGKTAWDFVISYGEPEALFLTQQPADFMDNSRPVLSTQPYIVLVDVGSNHIGSREWLEDTGREGHNSRQRLVNCVSCALGKPQKRTKSTLIPRNTTPPRHIQIKQWQHGPFVIAHTPPTNS